MHYIITLVELCGDTYTFKTYSETMANCAFTRNNSGSISYAQISLIDAPKGQTGKVISSHRLK